MAKVKRRKMGGISERKEKCRLKLFIAIYV